MNFYEMDHVVGLFFYGLISGSLESQGRPDYVRESKLSDHLDTLDRFYVTKLAKSCVFYELAVKGVKTVEKLGFNCHFRVRRRLLSLKSSKTTAVMTSL